MASAMNADERLHALETENAQLVAELEEAEAYEQHLRQLIMEVKGELAAGNHEKALSMLNAALSEIDSQTDVVVQHH